MAGFYVPIATNAIPGSVNEDIARGPDLSWIGNLPNAYWQGQDQAYQQRNRNAFPNGLPRDAQGNIDYNAVSNTLARAGGTSQAGPAIGMAQFPDLMKAVGSDNAPGAQPGIQSGMPANAPPSSAGGARPIPQQPQQPTTTDQGVTPGQVASANGGTMATPRQIAQNTGGDPETIARSLNVGVDDPVDMGNPQARQTVIGALRQQPQQPQQSPMTGGAVPGAQPVQTQQVAQAPAGDNNAALAQQYEQKAQEYYRRAAAFSMINPQIGARFQAMGDAASKAAEQYRGGAIKAGELTPEQKNVATGAPATSKLQESDAVAYGKSYASASKAAEGAQNGLDNIAVMKSLTQQPTFYSGPFDKGMQSYQQFKSIFGHDPTAATPMEAFQKEVNGLLREQIKDLASSGVGRVLQAEVSIMQKGIASLGLTPAGNRAQLEMLSRVYKQSMDLGAIADQVNQQVSAGRIPPGQYQQALKQATDAYYKNPAHHLYTPQEIQHPQTLGAPDAPPNWPQMSAQQQRAWAAQQNIQPGAGSAVRFNGQVVGVP